MWERVEDTETVHKAKKNNRWTNSKYIECIKEAIGEFNGERVQFQHDLEVDVVFYRRIKK